MPPKGAAFLQPAPKGPPLRNAAVVLTHMGEEMLEHVGDFDIETAEDGKSIVL